MVVSCPGRVLVVEDDPMVAEVVERYLTREGFTVETVADGRVALERASATPPDLVVLDLMLPGISGFDVCRRLRATATVPVVILTARNDEMDRIAGLDMGADDYLAKPFSPRELVARVKAVLRRAGGGVENGPQRLDFGDLVVDVPARVATRDGTELVLTAREFDLLAFMAHHPRRTFRREELLEHVWGFSFGDTATVTVHVRRLREKVEADPSNPTRIATVWGVGYRFDP